MKASPDINDTLRDEGVAAVRNRHDRSHRYDGGNGGGTVARTVIELQPGALHEVATKAEAALIAAGAPFYVRGGEIVRPIIEEVTGLQGPQDQGRAAAARHRRHDARPPLARRDIREVQRPRRRSSSPSTRRTMSPRSSWRAMAIGTSAAHRHHHDADAAARRQYPVASRL